MIVSDTVDSDLLDALGNVTTYAYDGNGNLVSKTDADGYVTQYSYTALDLVKKINYNGAKEVSYQYNKVGELVQMNDWTGTNTFELDLLGRLQKMTDHKGNTVSYTYDAVGNQTGITYPDGSKTRSFYDAVYNLTSVIDADDGTYAYVYDDANRPVKLTYPNGWVEQYTYDAEGNLLKTVDTDPFQLYNKTPKVKYEYTYDAEGNALTKFQRDSDATKNLKSRTTYTYDALNRLTGSTRKLEIYPYDTLSYTYSYDTLGNLLKQSGPTKGEEDSWQYNDLNQMVSKHSCGYEQKLTRIYDYGYTYDKRGNLVKEEEICSPTTTGPKNITIATYLYDETNRMVQGTNKTGEVSAYTFNGLGVRVGTEQILQDNSHGYTDFHCQTPSVETGIEKPEVVKTDYVIDYTRLGIDQRVLVKSEQDGYDFRYTYGLDKVKVYTTSEGSDWWGQNIHKCVNADYVHTDRLGSVVNLSDQYGRVTARADYTDWGEVRKYTDITVDQGFRRLLPEITYATHEYDDVLNQFYAKARMYDAENKRFTAVDPILDPAGYDISSYVVDPIQLVQYLYVKNNAINWIDMLGQYYIKKAENGKYFAVPASLTVETMSAIGSLLPGLGSTVTDALRAIPALDTVGGNSDSAKSVLLGAAKSYLETDTLPKFVENAFNKTAGSVLGKAFQVYSYLSFWGNLKKRTEIPRYDAIAFKLFSMTNIEPVGKTIREVDDIMAAAYIFVEASAWFFVEAAYGNVSFIIGNPQYSMGPTMFEILTGIQGQKTKEAITEKQSYYFKKFRCANYRVNKSVNRRLAVYKPVNTPTVVPKYVLVGYTTYFEYAVSNYSLVLSDVMQQFRSWVSAYLIEAKK